MEANRWFQNYSILIVQKFANIYIYIYMNNRDMIIVGLLAFVINKNITIKAIPE